MLHYGEKITCEGQLITDYFAENGQRTNVNYSDIVTELVQAAGMLCEYYASDIVYDIKDLENYIDNIREEIMFIGIRSNGCDGLNYVISRFKNHDTKDYIRLYRLETSIPDESHFCVELKRVDSYDVEKELIDCGYIQGK